MALHDAAIIAYGEACIVPVSDRDVWALGADILEQLLDRSGFEKGEIDGLILSASMTGAGNPFWSQTTADYLALELDFCQTVDIGGASPLGAVARAAAAIDTGLASTILCLYADTAVAETNARGRAYNQEWTVPIGYTGPPAAFGLLTNYYEAHHGLDYRALAKLAVTQREHAILNDLACAKLRKPITVDDYLQSRMINDPVRLLDSVMPCDGASGLLITSRKTAETRGLTRCVVPVGYGERTHLGSARAIVDPTVSGHRVAGEKCFAQAGLRPADIAAFHPYDDFIIAIMMQLECSAFARTGKGAASFARRVSALTKTCRSTPAVARSRRDRSGLPVAGPIWSRPCGNCSERPVRVR